MIRLNKISFNNWALVKVIKDLSNYVDWIKTLKKEESDQKSKYNKWKLQHNYFYTLYAAMSLDDADYALPEHIKKIRVLEMTNNLNIYLDEELGFAECLSPEFFNFYDDKNNPTLTYVVAYRFIFNKLSVWWLIKWGVLCSIMLYCILKFDLFYKFIECLKTLI